MVKDRFIKRVQPSLSSVQIQEQKKKTKDGSNSTTDLLSKLSKQNKEASEKRKAEKSKSKKRKTIGDDDEEDEGLEPLTKKKKTFEVTDLEFDTEEWETTDETIIDTENILWTTNYSQFIRTFRNESIIEYVEAKMGEQFAAIVKVAFEETSPYQRAKNDPVSSKYDDLCDLF